MLTPSLQTANYHGLPFLRRPNILSYPLDPVPQLINATIPILQPHPHVINLLHIQYLRLHPINSRNLRHLIDTTLQQPQTQSLHDQYFNFLRLYICLLADCSKSHGAVVRRPAEHGFGEGGEGDFLVEEGFVGFEEGRFGKVGFEDVVGG